MLNSTKLLNYTEEQATEYEARFNKATKEIADFISDYLKRLQTDESLCNPKVFDKQAFEVIQTSFAKHLKPNEAFALLCDSYVGNARKGLMMFGMTTLAGVFESMLGGKGKCTCPRCTGDLNSEQQSHQE